MSLPTVSPYLRVWTVISLRPAGQQAAMRRAIEARGACALALPALRLAPMPDAAAARRALRAALGCARLLFTSPAAVRFAHALQPLTPRPGQQVFAVGRGTALALRRRGMEARYPAAQAMRSEGLLALPELAREALRREPDVGLVTAPGGRGVIARALRARGARLRTAEVYRRVAPRFDRRHHAALIASCAPRALLLTSAEALDNALALLPDTPDSAGARLRRTLVVASSERLAAHARRLGFTDVIVAGAPTPAALLDALDDEAARRGSPHG